MKLYENERLVMTHILRWIMRGIASLEMNYFVKKEKTKQ